MNDESPEDELLDALGAHLRQRESAWEDVAHRRRSAEEVAAERADAGDSEADIELARALYQPIEAPADERGGGEKAPAEPGASSQPEAAANERRYTWWFVAAAAVAAVLIALALLPSEHSPDATLVAEALPAYAFDPGSQRAFVRGDPSPAPSAQLLRYHPSNILEWTLRPELEVQGELATRIYQLEEGGALIPLELGEALVLRPSGAATLDLRAGELGLEPGEWTLVWVIARARELAGEPVLDALERDAAVHVERLRVHIDAE